MRNEGMMERIADVRLHARLKGSKSKSKILVVVRGERKGLGFGLMVG